MIVPYLSTPPPFSGVHIMVETDGLVFVKIMSFRYKDEIRCKLRITVQGFEAFNDITEVDIKVNVSDRNLAAVKLGPSR